MKYTTNMRLPYPEPADPPRGADQIQGLAEQVDRYAGMAVRADSNGEAPCGGNRWNRVATPDLTGHGRWVPSGDGGLLVPVDGLYQVSGQLNFSDNGFTMGIGADDGGRPADGFAQSWTGSTLNLAQMPNVLITLLKGKSVYLWAFPGMDMRMMSGWFCVTRVGELPNPDKIPTREGPTY